MVSAYTPYEVPNTADQICRKLGVFDQKVNGSFTAIWIILERNEAKMKF